MEQGPEEMESCVDPDQPHDWSSDDVFGIFGVTENTDHNDDYGGDRGVSWPQYMAVVYRVMEACGLGKEEAEYVVNVEGSKKSDITALTSKGAADAPYEKPAHTLLCAHFQREGVQGYLNGTVAFPEVRCVDADEIGEVKSATCSDFVENRRGPHVHCLYCFHAILERSPPPRRGVPPPVVMDYGKPEDNGAALRRHYYQQRQLYSEYLDVLDGAVGDDGEEEMNGGGDEEDTYKDSLAECERVAEEASRHCVFIASIGTPACPVTVFYCAECEQFAPLTVFESPMSEFSRTPVENELSNDLAPATLFDKNANAQWLSVDDSYLIFSRLLLSCHLLQMVRTSSPSMATPHLEFHQPPVQHHALFLYKPEFFDEETEATLLEQFEDGVVCTYGSAVLPNAAVVSNGSLQLTIRQVPPTPPKEFSPVVIGFVMEWSTAEEVQEKVEMVLQHGDNTGCSKTLPLCITRRLVFLEDTQEWMAVSVLYHEEVPVDAELPLSFGGLTDPTQPIRMRSRYLVECPVSGAMWRSQEADPPSGLSGAVEHNASSSLDEAARAISSTLGCSNANTNSEKDYMDVMDGCPYSMESRTIDFFARMMAVATAVHEVTQWDSGNKGSS